MSKKIKSFIPEVTIKINDLYQEFSYLDTTERIKNSIAFIRTSDGEYRIPYANGFRFEGAYDKKTDCVYVRANLSNDIYEVSREQPYDRGYMMVFYVASRSFNAIIIFSEPVQNDGHLSGVYFDVGFRGFSRHKIEDLMSSYIQAISDNKLRTEMEKIFDQVTRKSQKSTKNQDLAYSPDNEQMLDGGDYHAG